MAVLACRKQTAGPSEETGTRTPVIEAAPEGISPEVEAYVQEGDSAPTTGSQPRLGAASSQCRDICAQSQQLTCGKTSDCEAECLQMRALPVCQEPLQAYYRCIGAQPAEHWECDPEDQLPTIKAGFCDQEQANYAACLMAQAV